MPKTAPTVRPTVEALEDRQVPSATAFRLSPDVFGVGRSSIRQPERLDFLDDKECSGWTFEVRKDTTGSTQWMKRGTYATFRQMLQARVRFLRMGFRVRNIRQVCGEGAPPTDTTPTTTTPTDPTPGSTAALTSLRKAILDMEEDMPWEASHRSWRWKRPLWVADVKAASTTTQIGELLTELEANTYADVFKDGWKARREAWVKDVAAAMNFGKLETLRAEFASNLIV